MATPAAASQSPSAYVSYDTLTVTGTNAADVLALRLAAGEPNTLQVDFGDDGAAEFSFDRTTFSKIDVSLRNGNDQYRVDQVNGSFADETITVDGGNGNDTMNGGDGNEVFYGGNGADTADGNRGADTGFMGNGSDTFRWDPGDGSDIVEGDNGTDTLDFNGAPGVENMALSANGTRSLFFRDAGNIRMDMNEVERLDLTALGGADTVTIEDMSGTGFRRADVDLTDPAGGPGGVDIVTVKGTVNADRVRVNAVGAQVQVKGLATQVNVIGSEVADQLKINTLDGKDVVRVDGGVFGLISPSVDLGSQA
jgi:hypothetical protein